MPLLLLLLLRGATVLPLLPLLWLLLSIRPLLLLLFVLPPLLLLWLSLSIRPLLLLFILPLLLLLLSILPLLLLLWPAASIPALKTPTNGEGVGIRQRRWSH